MDPLERWDYSLIPLELKSGLTRYIKDRIETGSFLRAVLENDLRKATIYGTDPMVPFLPLLMNYLYHECPPECWGSEAKVEKWLTVIPEES